MVLRLVDLMNGDTVTAAQRATLGELDIAGLAADSRQVRPGYLFAALPGTRHDGRAFIADALKRGAVAVLAPPGNLAPSLPATVAQLSDDNPRRRFALMAARFFERQPETIAAVTGTNGKTSVASFTRQIWTRLGHAAGSLGTLGIVAPGIDEPLPLTTPDPVSIHRNLANLADAGVNRLAIEASSHGLAQFRLDGVRIKAAAFTNLSRDHLDYHDSEAGYLAAKTRLFDTLLPAGGTAVLNVDCQEYPGLAAVCRERGQQVIGYGGFGADIRLAACETDVNGQRLAIGLAGRTHDICLPLFGRFQASNALCALGLVIACGEDPGRAIGALESLEGVRGRLELAAHHPSGAPVFVDYAHSPDALANVLHTLRPHVGGDGRLVVLFGCGGDRDAGKRPIMGQIAADLADVVFVTDDNPRGEDPATIRTAILAACPAAREIGDRRSAIRAAVAVLQAGDLLLVAGKGHEQGQIVDDRVLPFDDVTIVRAAIADLKRAS